MQSSNYRLPRAVPSVATARPRASAFRGLLAAVCAFALVAAEGCAPAPRTTVTAPLPVTPAAGKPQPLTGKDLGEPPAWARTDAQLPEGAGAANGAIILSADDYRIGPADEIDVQVFQVEELSGLRRVNSRGQIRMPLIGTVDVAGRSAQEVEDLLVERYAKDYLQDPQITVEVKLFASQQVTVLGALQKPGVYPLTGRTTLLQALALAGGPNPIADQAQVVVFRAENGGNVYGYLVNVNEIISGAKPDPEVIGSDRIVVPESGLSSFWRSWSLGVPGVVGYRQY